MEKPRQKISQKRREEMHLKRSIAALVVKEYALSAKQFKNDFGNAKDKQRKLTTNFIYQNERHN